SAYGSSNQLLGSRDTSLDSSRSSASKSVLGVLYLSSRATFVCLAFARPRPMARPPRKRVRGGRGNGGPVYLDNFFLTPSVPCGAGATRCGMVCPTVGPLTMVWAGISRLVEPCCQGRVGCACAGMPRFSRAPTVFRLLTRLRTVVRFR